MDTNQTSTEFRQLKIGDIFTPQKWAEFAISEFGLFAKWMKGATIFDPTMGSGNLLQSFVTFGQKQGYNVSELPIKSLYGNELNTCYHARALRQFREKTGVDMTENFRNHDISDLKPHAFDILLGNPPWQNYVDLPLGYRERLKPLFIEYELTGNVRNLLLGGSRIDIAALIIRMSIKNFLKAGGEAVFFMPLSLLLNDGANERFRTYTVKGIGYAPKKIFDFHKEDVFEKIATRYGLVHFSRDATPVFPVDYMILNQGRWEHYLATPLLTKTSPLSIYAALSNAPLDSFIPIELPKASMPRQGINTCGANDLFFFNEYKKTSGTTCVVNGTTELPAKYVFPLLKAANFKHNHKEAKAWVLLPYNSDGRPISPAELEAETALREYLYKHREKLTSRNGTLISTWMKKGYWWALLGVGPYNYAPWKIVWEAYGKKRFNPILIDGHWQANQDRKSVV